MIEKIKSKPESVQFKEVIDFIDTNYTFTPAAFKNGETQNEAGQNNGSCKVFAFGLLNQLSKDETLACFGEYYRKDVLGNPEATDHQNIRNFMKSGWEGVKFEVESLKAKV
ncbi:HopJ type III effector protein [Arcticibacterium luteifluviistationis]|uniref:Type III effector n=1 Tax=Arcticibacterium luteifluviistationis TaxID=1784714 RepID=A0A2Z4G8N8_9BACT|nr:HopJ type III effector protein [Arcticibacterium luteifluviistationis]AWV97353.1 type III effector [Arcticibacterium luteifluviistationis]